jgi:hypothetical protein
MADHVGACAARLTPLYELIKAHVFAAARIHGDDTTVPVLAKMKTRTGRIWTYVRDDRPFGGNAPSAAVRLPQSPSPAPLKSSARTRSSSGTWLPAWSRRTAASGSMAPTTRRPSPSRVTAWNVSGNCSRSTNAIDHPRGPGRMVTESLRQIVSDEHELR